MSDPSAKLRARIVELARTQDPYAHVFAGKEFRRDYVAARTIAWSALFGDIRQTTGRVLEIGSKEGRSALFWLEFFASAHLTCVDLFENDDAGRFDRNLAAYGARLRKMVSTSIKALGILREENAVFDFIYVDGSHQRDDVMIDCLGAWRLLRAGGVMLMDDYTWKPDNPDAERVAPAVDTFLAWHEDAEVILRSHQVAVRKRPA
ncbi:class I SAM-dependent methyltransferase [Bradyrhizobium manausense]|uniref:class I SAM-dependent methyltransferase n=1 Tax=Bradyrhizobium manausense TaxID=989370 RepID=UPI001BA669D7|nr:class I SAM-dependent methyltransferase [Bradyrhizobium manausense]MBR0688798.1 class I SAM-dependent methyltransferase [Bradyrhizobium manausense]MBR0723610.1 class I SAM-dependent methyltransferase [Bradyrhizobium manausense]